MAYPTLTEIKRAKVAQMTAAVQELERDLAKYGRERDGRFFLFGSAARGELRYDSDVDVLVDFVNGSTDDAVRFAEERARELGLKPDIRPMTWSGPNLRERVASEGRRLP